MNQINDAPEKTFEPVLPTGSIIAMTGSLGFIGRRLVEALRSHGWPLIILDGDVRSVDTWREDFNILFHLAAATPAGFSKDPAGSYSTNVGGVINALEACRERKARMVFPSTCGVYLPKVSGALSEDHPIEGRTPYSTSKLIGEILCKSYSDTWGVPCTIMRFFNVYGGGQEPSFLIPYLIECSLEGREAIVKHPDSVRDFIHVEDVVTSLLKTANSTRTFDLINVGSGRPCSVRRIIVLISTLTGKALSWTQGLVDPDVHASVWANIERARELLKWHPQVDLEQGLMETMDYMKEPRVVLSRLALHD